MSAGPAPLLRVTGLTRTFQDGPKARPVLQGVSLSLAEGEWVAILGPSGAGKSTLLNILGGLDGAFEGEAEVAGLALKGAPDPQLAAHRRETVGYVFQDDHLLRAASVLDNVLLPARFGPEGVGAGVRARASALLERVGLADRALSAPDRLSRGERQRVAVARALLGRPRVLLCDEPTAALDAASGDQVLDLFAELHAEGMTLLMVTHEERAARRAERRLRLDQGRLEATDEAGAP